MTARTAIENSDAARGEGASGEPAPAPTVIVYDGHCPVCTAYTCAMEGADVRLVDARKGGALVDDLTRRGFDLDDGMVVLRGDEVHHGAEAVHAMAVRGMGQGLIATLNRLIFSSARRSRLLYPVLRAGRNLLLRLLGRTKIADQRGGLPD